MATSFIDVVVTDTLSATNTDIINGQFNSVITNSLITDTFSTDTITPSTSTISIQGSIVNIGTTGSQVNILGSLNYIESDIMKIKDPLLTMNAGGTNTTCIGSGIEFEGSSSVIKASLKLDNNLDFIIDSTNDKLTVSNITCTNLSGLSTVSSSSGTITDLNSTTINTGTLTTTSDVTLGDSPSDSIIMNGTITGFTSNGVASITNATSSSSSTTGALKVNGGISTQNNIYASGTINAPTITGTTLAGTLSTASQPNITSVGILNGLQVMTNNLLIGSLGTNLYVNNSSGKVGFGTGSTLASSSKVEVVGGLKADTLDVASFTPSTINTTTLTTANLTVSGNTILGDASTDTLTCNAQSQFLGGIRYRNTGTYDRIYTATGSTTSGQRTFTTPAFMFSSLPIATVSCIVDDLNMRICWIRTATYSSTTGIATFVCRVVATDNSTVSGVPVNIICIGD